MLWLIGIQRCLHGTQGNLYNICKLQIKINPLSWQSPALHLPLAFYAFNRCCYRVIYNVPNVEATYKNVSLWTQKYGWVQWQIDGRGEEQETLHQELHFELIRKHGVTGKSNDTMSTGCTVELPCITLVQQSKLVCLNQGFEFNHRGNHWRENKNWGSQRYSGVQSCMDGSKSQPYCQFVPVWPTEHFQRPLCKVWLYMVDTLTYYSLFWQLLSVIV